MKIGTSNSRCCVALLLALLTWAAAPALAQTPEATPAPEAPEAAPAIAAEAPTPSPSAAPAIAGPVVAPAPRPVVAKSPRPVASVAPVVAPRAPRPPLAGFEGGYLGVEILDLTPELREHFGAPREAGVMISRVQAGSPAARAGLKPGDVILEVDEQATHDSWELSRVLVEREAGKPVAIVILRDKRRQTVSAELERRRRDGFDVGSLLAPRAETPFPGFPGHLEPAIEQFRAMLDQPEFGEKLREMQMRVDRDVEQKMKELEARLKELEEKLARLQR